MTYDLHDLNLPRLTGFQLKLAAKAIRNPLIAPILGPILLNNLGFSRLKRFHSKLTPRLLPLHPHPIERQEAKTDSSPESQAPQKETSEFQFREARDFTRAYKERIFQPSTIAERIINTIQKWEREEDSFVALSQFAQEDILQQAKSSTQRWQAGTPLSPLDGVPISVKEELDLLPYATNVGTWIYRRNYPTTDATVVARLRKAGALLIGKAVMHEIGIGVTGFNTHYGMPQNPYQLRSYPGGSSSGSAVSVASGLCPISIGADGGGSIRIPASFCGVYGLKATFGRISEAGAAPLCWSVAHVGPIANSIRDLALSYQTIAGPDSRDPNSQNQPAPDLPRRESKDLSGTVIGIHRDWFEHSDSEIVQACQHAVDHLVRLGASVKPITVEYLEESRLAHAVTIASEMLTSMSHAFPSQAHEFGLDVQMNLGLASAFQSSDYLKAQQIRAQAIQNLEQIFLEVDVIATPTTACTSPFIPEDALPHGESDLTVLTRIMRYAFLANLTGIPGLSAPVGYDHWGKPIGLQLMGRPWQESMLIRFGHALQEYHGFKRPQRYVDLLV
ncbi:MAG: amidase [Myxococcota bacterium]|nr:amidase [Myxococcota bacterium]